MELLSTGSNAHVQGPDLARSVDTAKFELRVRLSDGARIASSTPRVLPRTMVGRVLFDESTDEHLEVVAAPKIDEKLEDW